MLVIMPTYNEADNLRGVIERVHAAAPFVHVLVIDDGSPDGTGSVADALAASDERNFVLHRPGKLGLGSAYVLGFGWGLERGYELLGEMDADGSHPPETLPRMIAAIGAGRGDGVGGDDSGGAGDSEEIADAGLVIGSRRVPGAGVTNWPRHRVWLSRVGNTYARIALGISVRDSTAGFRVFRADVLRNIRLDEVDSKGYCFQVDMTLRVLDAGYRVVEVPIVFHEREHGESKMSRGIVLEAMWRVTVWALRRRLRLRRGTRRMPGH